MFTKRGFCDKSLFTVYSKRARLYDILKLRMFSVTNFCKKSRRQIVAVSKHNYCHSIEPAAQQNTTKASWKPKLPYSGFLKNQTLREFLFSRLLLS